VGWWPGVRGPTDEELAAVNYVPEPVAGWTLSTPEEHGLDPGALAELYWRAGQLETIRNLLVVKDGELVAASYFHDGSPTHRQMVASVTKSFTGALVGVAIDQGCIPNVDTPMMTYFPQLANDLGVAEGTVRKHLEILYRNLGVNSRTEALARVAKVATP
jgi:hypothetical protein